MRNALGRPFFFLARIYGTLDVPSFLIYKRVFAFFFAAVAIFTAAHQLLRSSALHAVGVIVHVDNRET